MSERIIVPGLFLFGANIRKIKVRSKGDENKNETINYDFYVSIYCGRLWRKRRIRNNNFV